MIIINSPIGIQVIKNEHSHFFETMVKIVVDLEKEIIALDAELHADLEQILLENESDQHYLWGGNIYFDKPNFIEFSSLINIRPAQENKSMQLQNPDLQEKMSKIVNKLIIWNV